MVAVQPHVPQTAQIGAPILGDARVGGALRVYAALAYYADASGMSHATQTDLTRLLGCTRSAITQGLAKLLTLGYVEQVPAPAKATYKGAIYRIRDYPRVLEQPATLTRKSGGRSATAPKTCLAVLNNLLSSTKQVATAPARHRPKPTPLVRKNRSAHFIDAMTALGLALGQHYDLSGRDHAAIKSSSAEPALLAEAFVALRAGYWGDQYQRGRCNVYSVADQINSYRVWRDQHAGQFHGQRAAAAIRGGPQTAQPGAAELLGLHQAALHDRVSVPVDPAPRCAPNRRDQPPR